MARPRSGAPKPPICLHCERRARLIKPWTKPTFCSLRCAAAYGFSKARNVVWCGVHKQWSDSVAARGCEACSRLSSDLAAIGPVEWAAALGRTVCAAEGCKNKPGNHQYVEAYPGLCLGCAEKSLEVNLDRFLVADGLHDTARFKRAALAYQSAKQRWSDATS